MRVPPSEAMLRKPKAKRLSMARMSFCSSPGEILSQQDAWKKAQDKTRKRIVEKVIERMAAVEAQNGSGKN